MHMRGPVGAQKASKPHATPWTEGGGDGGGGGGGGGIDGDDNEAEKERLCSHCASLGIECVPQPSLKFRYHPLQKILSDGGSFTDVWQRTSRSPRASLCFHDETPELLATYHQGEQPLTTEARQQPPSLPQDSPALAQSVGEDGDPFRTFETVVSHLALTDLVIRHAICAFSARHYYRCGGGGAANDDGDGNSKALAYQNRCLNFLIPSMSDSSKMSPSVLTAVALLRQNEEMDEQDNRFHLEGTSRILNMVPEFAALGGVGEAACWLSLREDIYVSLTTQTPIKANIDCFLNSPSIRRSDDYSWASLSILNLAYLLKRAFSEPLSLSDLAQSRNEIEDWDFRRPSSYYPFKHRPRSRQEGRCFPEIWMLLPHHAVGLQYYHISRILLSAVGSSGGNGDESSPPTHPPSTSIVHTYRTLAESRVRERQIKHHLYAVLGLATSNPRAENTWFTARHCLAVWGAYFRHPADHHAVLEFLEIWRRRSGWRTADLVDSLRQHWSEHDDE
ncbi:hypothetical protein D0863_08759 [Hortaea werneckii]|uniref:Zn(2)-C6 fungal-type domain-containing protein n=1 Tax=Hortaea werneckii TaxID=91943 RepID=A0A3M7DNZ0_HORWE|nr:hypothetical protein D0863_08759 [Hortaea werneckii]